MGKWNTIVVYNDLKLCYSVFHPFYICRLLGVIKRELVFYIVQTIEI